MIKSYQAKCLIGTPHGFMTRRGGVSTGLVSGLQCGFGAEDNPHDVAQNRKLAAAQIVQGAPLVSPYQVHSADVAVVTEPWDNDARPVADALVTHKSGIALGIITADCAPVLLADRESGVIGAAHAGWRGAHAGILENTVAAMLKLGAQRENIAAAVGPCIAQSSYEVSADFREKFEDADSPFFTAGKPGHFHFNLEAYCAKRLEHAGIREIETLGLDTYARPEEFYSFRRATHQNDPNYGRQLSLIALN